MHIRTSAGLRAVFARRRYCARQPGAARLGHDPVGQRLRRMEQTTFSGARKGAVVPAGQYAQHEVQGIVWPGPQRGQPPLSRLQGLQVSSRPSCFKLIA